MIGHGLTLAGLGIAIGLALSWLAGPLISHLLYRARPNDPWIMASVAAVIALVTLVACAIPALRASRVAPAETLRRD